MLNLGVEAIQVRGGSGPGPGLAMSDMSNTAFEAQWA